MSKRREQLPDEEGVKPNRKEEHSIGDLPSLDFEMPTMPELPTWDDDPISPAPKRKESSVEPEPRIGKTDDAPAHPPTNGTPSKARLAKDKSAPQHYAAAAGKSSSGLRDLAFTIHPNYLLGHPINVIAACVFYVVLIYFFLPVFRFATVPAILFVVGHLIYKNWKRIGQRANLLKLTKERVVFLADHELVTLRWRKLADFYLDRFRDGDVGFPLAQTTYLCLRTRNGQEYRVNITGLQQVGSPPPGITISSTAYNELLVLLKKYQAEAHRQRLLDAGLG